MEFPEIITLSVGGKIFQTTLATLTKDPDSMLYAMFSGRHNITQDEEGRYFIDRDGSCFRYILNYLRTGQLVVPRDNLSLLTELVRECRYFQLGELADEVEIKKEQAEKQTMTYKDFLRLANIRSPIQAPLCNFEGIKISYMDLTRANLQGCDFSNCIINEVNLTLANLSKSTFKNTSITNSQLREAVLDGSNCQGANFSGNDMRKALCRDVNFVQAKLGGTDLRGCDMQGSNFTDANLRVANLEGATFHFANLLRVNLEGANTKGVRGSIEGYRSSR